MKVLVVGSGSREHAIVWKLAQSSLVAEIFAAPGNAGTQSIAHNEPIPAEDIDALLDFAQRKAIDFTIVGPEQPLTMGIVDRFKRAGMSVFGPTQAAAQIESSKVFAKRLMTQYGVPTAVYEAFTTYDSARAYVSTCPIPVVVKADGLAAGKGVTVAHTREEALDAVRAAMLERQFGSAGDCVLIEECMVGQEVSVFAFVDGDYVSPMVAACDYKRVGDGDTGPNTGGMGSFSPPAPQHWNAAVEAQVRQTIMQPIAEGLARMGCPYQGVLYLGMMLTGDEPGTSGDASPAFVPKVVEFNCRLGDPETQAILPRLKTDLAQVMFATTNGTLADMAIDWDERACVGVVLASDGYPGSYDTGYAVHGVDAVGADAMVFHAGTKSGADGELLTAGGRVLTVSALGDTLPQARAAAYDNICRIEFEGAFHRNDIAAL